MKINKIRLSIFLTIFIALYPIIFKLTDYKITKKNNLETISNASAFITIKFRNFNELGTFVDKNISDINFNFFDNKKFIKFDSEKYKTQLITAENLISKYTIEDIKNIDYDNVIGVSETASKKVTLTAKNKILLLFNFEFMADIIEKNLGEYSFDFDDECSKIFINDKKISIVNYTTYQIKSEIKYQKNIYGNSDNYYEIKNLAEKCLVKNTNIKNFITKYTESYDKISKEDFNDDINKFIIENSNSFSNKEAQKSFKDQISIIRDKIISKIKDTDIMTDIVFISQIHTKSNFAKNYNIYSITFILNLLITTIIFYILIYFKKNL